MGLTSAVAVAGARLSQGTLEAPIFESKRSLRTLRELDANGRGPLVSKPAPTIPAHRVGRANGGLSGLLPPVG